MHNNKEEEIILSKEEYIRLKELENQNIILKKIIDITYKNKFDYYIVQNTKGKILYPFNKEELKNCYNMLFNTKSENDLVYFIDENNNKKIFKCTEEAFNIRINDKYEIIIINALKDITFEKDYLTKLDIKPIFNLEVKNYLNKIIGRNEEFCYVFLDLDDFKILNETYGHESGDYILKTLGTIIKNNIRREDLSARYEGDKFIFILKNISYENSIKKLKSIKEEFKKIEIEIDGKKISNPSTMSIGGYQINGKDINFDSKNNLEEVHEVIKSMAEQNLFIVKNSKKDEIMATKNKLCIKKR